MPNGPGDRQSAWSADTPVAGDSPAPQLHTLALDALAQIQAALQSNTALAQQSAALEEQIQRLLDERIALFERIEMLEARLAEREPLPFRPLAELPAALHHDRLEAVAFTRRLARARVSDEEILLGSSSELANGSPSDSAPPLAPFAPQGYTLTARPFARFTDLGGFQEAVQALPGIRNVRVRRFAQSTLEMRLDYDGIRPLTDLLRGLELPIEEVVEEEPAHLSLRLAPLDERSFPALS